MSTLFLRLLIRALAANLCPVCLRPRPWPCDGSCTS